MQRGFSFVELLVGVALLVIVFVGIYGAFQLGLNVVGHSKTKVTAIAIANQKIEQISNLPYNYVGTLSGVPSGVIPEVQEEFRNKVSFMINTTVLYVDDPFDGVEGAGDALPKDYKRAKVRVYWTGYFGGAVELITDVAPKGIETEGGGGTLKILVLDASGQGVPAADIHIFNDQVFPSINATYTSDVSGSLIIPGNPTSTEAYQITVTKTGFSQDRTYGIEEVVNPLKPHQSVFDGQVTEVTFIIDKLSEFSIETRGRESFDDSFGNWSKVSESFNITSTAGTIELAQVGSYATSGYLVSVEISTTTLTNWDRLFWEDGEPEFTDIKYQLLYATNSDFELIPDGDLPGNSEGFDLSPVSISGLDVAKYPKLKIKGNLLTSVISATPSLFDWHLTYNTPLIGDVDFHLQGLKSIGTDGDGKNVYKYSQDHTSNLTGYYTISSLEWDAYMFFETTTTGMNLVETIPSSQPIALLPNTITNVIMYFKAENNLLVNVQDASTTEPIFGAGVRVYNNVLGYDNLKPTDEDGKAFFIPLEATLYNLEAGAATYNTTSTTVSVSGNTTRTLGLEKEYPVLVPNIDQAHYRWRNDDGGEEDRRFDSDAAQDGYIAEENGSTYVVRANLDFAGAGYSKTVTGAERRYRGYLSFNTSDIPDDAVITEAILRLKTQTDYSEDEDTDVTVYSTDYGSGLGEEDWTSPETIEGVLMNTADYVDETYFEMNVSTLNINTTSTTQYKLKGGEASHPGGRWSRYITFYSGDSVGNKPRLFVSWEGGGAAWLAAEDTATTTNKNTNVRVRFLAENTGVAAENYNYRLQWAEKTGYGYCTLVPVTNFSDVSTTTGEAVMMATSTYFDDGATTTDLAGGLTNPSGLTFTAGRMVEHPSNQTVPITLNQDYFTEHEYVFKFTDNATSGLAYCLRMANGENGIAISLDSYSQVAELMCSP